MLVSIVCYFMLFSVAHTFNVNIYKYEDYNTGNKPVHIVHETYKFEFNVNETIIVDIRLKNKAPDVDARVYITYKLPTMNKSGDLMNKPLNTYNEDCLSIRLPDDIKSRKSESKSIFIGIQLKKENVACATQVILEGNATLPVTTKKDTDRSLCLNQPKCVVVLDVQEFSACQGETDQQLQSGSASQSTSFSQTNILIYVIPSVIVMCVIMLAVYLGVKKVQRRRDSDPEATMELKTYSTNEVLYADLSFVNGNSQPQRKEEESPYAEIIGVLKHK